MPSALAALSMQVQEMKAQSLSALMAVVDPASAAAKITGNYTGNADATTLKLDAAIRAIIIDAQPSGRAILQVAGGTVEAELPPEIMRQAAQNPNLLKPGNTLLLPSDIPARPLATPATLVSVKAQPHPAATGTSVGPAPPLASPFPPGSLGAAIARLSGIAFPGAEPEGVVLPQGLPAGTPPATNPAQAAQRAMFAQSSLASAGISPELGDALMRATSRQMPLANALTQILSLDKAALDTLPQPVADAIRMLQTLRASPEGLGTTRGLQNAVRNSGLFLETNIAARANQPPATGADTPANAAGTTQQTPIRQDLKSVLLTLQSLFGDDMPAAELEMSGDNRLAAPDSKPALSREARQENALRTDHPEIARAVEGAVERVKLMQMASMPEHPEIRVTDDRAQPMRLALSVPIATKGSDHAPTAVMGLVIEHRPPMPTVAPYEAEKNSKSDVESFPWKVRVALDLAETGPVQAEIALRGQSVAVTLWAERPTIASRARDEIGALHAALTGAAFDVVKLDVKDGRPQGRVAPPTPMLDRRT